MKDALLVFLPLANTAVILLSHKYLTKKIADTTEDLRSLITGKVRQDGPTLAQATVAKASRPAAPSRPQVLNL